MASYPSLKRALAAVLTCAVLGAAVYFMNRNGSVPNPIDANPVAAQDTKGNNQDWVMYGGTPARNMANTAAKGLPVEWDADAKPMKGIKWVAELGSKAYGGPIIAGGRVYV